MPLARISLTLSRHFSLSFIASCWSSGLYPVSLHSCCMYVQAGRPAFAWPCVGVHRSTSLMSSSLLLQQCPACLVRLTWIVFVMGGWWPNSWCLVGCCCQDLFNIARNPMIKMTFINTGWLIDLLFDFNGMSIRSGVFYALRLENCVHWRFIFIFLYKCSLRFFCMFVFGFVKSAIKYK